MHIAQTRLSIATAPREIKEITAEVGKVDRAPAHLSRPPTLYIPHTSAPLPCQRMSRHTATMTKGRTTCRPTSRAR